MSTLKKLASQTVIYGISNILPRILNYFLLVYLYTRILALGEYGDITKLYAYVAFLVVFLTYGMETAFFNFSRKEEYSESEVFSVAFKSHIFSSIVFLIACVFLAKNIAAFLKIPEHPNYVIYLAIILVFDTVCALPFALLRKQNKAKKFACIKILNILINIILNLFFLVVLPKFSVQFLTDKIALILLANLIASVCTFLMLIPSISIKNKQNVTLYISMLKYATPLLFAGLAGMINETLDRAMMDTLLPSTVDVKAQVGIYGACYKLAMLMSIFIQAYRYAAEPFFFGNKSDSDIKNKLAITTNLLHVICLFILLVILLNISWIQTIIDIKYRSGIYIIPYLLIAYLFFALYTNLSMWFKLSNKTSFGFLFTCLGALITIVLNYYCIPKYGIIGGAYATLACYIAMFTVCVAMSYKYFRIPINWKKFITYNSLALFVYLIAVVVFKNIIWLNNLILFIFIWFIIYNEKSILKLAQKL